MKSLLQALPALLWLALCRPAAASLTPAQAQRLPPPAARPVSFGQEIQPILQASCVPCHGKGRDKGGFQIDTRESLLKGGESGPAVILGRSGESLLIELVSGVDPDNVMPRKGTRLTPTQVGLLRAWIDQGLPWEAQVTFGKPTPPNLLTRPAILDLPVAPGVNPIDQILRPYFASNHFSPAPAVGDRVFARRVSLDVIGLLPPPAELDGFVADTQPEKRPRLVRRLLADNQRYAEHWLTFWNDLLRNDYRGTGYIDGGRRPITTWLFAALATNLPYDQFVAQLINPSPASEGFIKGIVWRGAVNASQSPPLQAAQNIAQVFMGVNLKCASCHDSFINDWRLSDAYGLASIYSERPLELFQCDKPTGKTAEARFLYPELGALDPHADKPARLRRLAEIISGPKDGRLPRTIVNRLWARFFQHGLVELLDDMEQPAWNPDLLDWLAEDLAAHGYDLKHTMEQILTSQAYQLPSVSLGEAADKRFVFRGPGVRRLSAEQFRDALAQLTGVWYDRAEFPAATNQIRASLVAADPLGVALGRPNREQVLTSRASAATTLQALELTNGETLAKVLQRGAHALTAATPHAKPLLDQLYRQALGRPPSPAEQELAANLLGDTLKPEAVEDLLWALVMLPEFQLIF